MEVDWEIEIGGDAPIIEAQWPGFVDLAQEPDRVHELAEVRAFAALGEALLALNRAGSPVSTSKCDFWPSLETGTWDPYEMDAVPAEASCATGCYIDLIARALELRRDPEKLATYCKQLCKRLKALPLPCCRADLLVRRAWTGTDSFENGITLYLTACGATQPKAETHLTACLHSVADAIHIDG